MKNELLDIYYDLSELFDDNDEVLISALMKYGKCKYKRSIIRMCLSNLKLSILSESINELYDTDIRVIRAYKLREEKIGLQSSIFDFIGE